MEECRLLHQQGQIWTRDLCKSCPVPNIARANSCQFMKLNAVITRPLSALFLRRVQVTAYCEKSERNVIEPQVGCGDCHSLPFTFEIRE